MGIRSRLIWRWGEVHDFETPRVKSRLFCACVISMARLEWVGLAADVAELSLASARDVRTARGLLHEGKAVWAGLRIGHRPLSELEVFATKNVLEVVVTIDVAVLLEARHLFLRDEATPAQRLDHVVVHRRLALGHWACQDGETLVDLHGHPLSDARRAVIVVARRDEHTRAARAADGAVLQEAARLA